MVFDKYFTKLAELISGAEHPIIFEEEKGQPKELLLPKPFITSCSLDDVLKKEGDAARTQSFENKDYYPKGYDFENQRMYEIGGWRRYGDFAHVIIFAKIKKQSLGKYFDLIPGTLREDKKPMPIDFHYEIADTQKNRMMKQLYDRVVNEKTVRWSDIARYYGMKNGDESLIKDGRMRISERSWYLVSLPNIQNEAYTSRFLVLSDQSRILDTMRRVRRGHHARFSEMLKLPTGMNLSLEQIARKKDAFDIRKKTLSIRINHYLVREIIEKVESGVRSPK